MGKKQARRRVLKNSILIELKIEGLIMAYGPKATGADPKSVLSSDAMKRAASDPIEIRYDLMRVNKPLSQITAADVPPGFDPEDVANDSSE